MTSLPDSKIIIVDGHNLLFRSFFGIPPRKTKSGELVHGIFGFLGILRKMVAQSQATHCIVVFDSELGSNRADVFPRYKKNRTDYSKLSKDQNPFTQLKPIKKALDGLRIPWIELDGQEADDVMASISLKFSWMKPVIATLDSDLFQIVNDQISVLRYRGEKSQVVTPSWITSRFGITPDQFVLFKAIKGDSSDNIPGLRGFGPVAARSVILGEKLLTPQQEKLVTKFISVIRIQKIDVSAPKEYEMLVPNGFQTLKIGEFLKALNLL